MPPLLFVASMNACHCFFCCPGACPGMATNDEATPTLSSAIPTLMLVADTPTSVAVSGGPPAEPPTDPVVPAAPVAPVVPAPPVIPPVVLPLPAGPREDWAPGARLEPVAGTNGAPVVDVD